MKFGVWFEKNLTKNNIIIKKIANCLKYLYFLKETLNVFSIEKPFGNEKFEEFSSNIFNEIELLVKFIIK